MRIDITDSHTPFGIKKFITQKEYQMRTDKKMTFLKLIPNEAAKIDKQMKKVSERIKYNQGQAWQRAEKIIINK